MSFFSKLFGNKNADETEILSAIKAGALLLDVRSAGEFKAGSVRGAVNVPVDNLTSQVGKLKNAKSIVVFCRSGNRSRMAKSILEELGFKNILDAGTWQSVNQIITKNQ